MHKILASFCFFFIIICSGSVHVFAQLTKESLNKSITTHTSPTKHHLTYQIINSEQNTFGYDIIDHGRPLIHQPSVPGLQGNKGFKTKENASKVARLIIKKINKNIMPPTITQQELKNLKINI